MESIANAEIGYLKVSSKSSPASVAGAIAGMIKDGVVVDIQAVGAGAVIDGEYRTAIKFAVEPRYLKGVVSSFDYNDISLNYE